MTWLIPIACLVAGIVAGWFLRRGASPPSLRVIEEMYSRKARVAEKARDGAIQELNANRVEMTTFAERFEGLDKRIADLGAELARARSAKKTVEGEVELRGDELAALGEELAEARREESLARILCAEAQEEGERAAAAQDRAEEEAQGRRAEAARLEKCVAELEAGTRGLTTELEARGRARTAAESEAAALRAELTRTKSTLAGLREELAALSGLPAELDGARAALARGAEELAATMAQRERTHSALETLQAEHQSRAVEFAARERELHEARDELVRLGSELEGVRAEREDLRAGRERLEDERSGLASANAELASARGALAQRAEELSLALAEREAELGANAARLCGLEPLPEELRLLRAELAERERAHQAAEGELERVWKERAESWLREKDSALDEERQRNAELALRREELVLELERTRAHERELQTQSDAHSTEGLELRAECERLELERNAEKEARRMAEAQLGERAGRIAELEGTLRGKDFQIRELPRLSRELEQAQAKGLELQRNLVGVQGRVRELETGAKAREREGAELRRELAQQEKDLRAAQAAREKAATQLQESVEHLQELEGELRQKGGLVRDLEAQLRRRPAASDTLQPAPRKPSERDDLKRITGIGPVLEKKLVRLGYRTYRQIAALNKEEIETLAQRLGTSPERIRREGWLASAREAMRS